jgi:hypothetical protein
LKRRILVAALVALALSACSLIVGIGDHTLRPGTDAGIDATSGDAPHPDAPRPRVDAGTDAPMDATFPDASDDASDDAPDGGVVAALAQGLHSPTGIWTDYSYVYWIQEDDQDASTGALLSMPVDGGAVTTLLGGLTRPHAVRTAPGFGTFLFFSADGVPDAATPGVYRIPKGGATGIPTTIATSDDGRGFGAMGAQASIFTAAADPEAGPPALRMTNPGGLPDGSCYAYTSDDGGAIVSVTVDAPDVYFLDTSAGAILRIPIGCDQTPTPFAAVDAAGVVTHGPASVFWTTDQTVLGLPKIAPGGAPTDYGPHCTSPRALTFPFVDDAGISEEFYATCSDGTVWRVPLAGSSTAPVRIASGQANPTSITSLSDGTPVWTNHDSGEIMTLRP